jgi:hypothetical protein
MSKINVRIAVAVGSNGNWMAQGHSNSDGSAVPDKDLVDFAYEFLEADNNAVVGIRFIEAELDVPEAEVIQGKVFKVIGESEESSDQ